MCFGRVVLRNDRDQHKWDSNARALSPASRPAAAAHANRHARTHAPPLLGPWAPWDPRLFQQLETGSKKRTLSRRGAGRPGRLGRCCCARDPESSPLPLTLPGAEGRPLQRKPARGVCHETHAFGTPLRAHAGSLPPLPAGVNAEPRPPPPPGTRRRPLPTAASPAPQTRACLAIQAPLQPCVLDPCIPAADGGGDSQQPTPSRPPPFWAAGATALQTVGCKP
jgi:hypothetical protein